MGLFNAQFALQEMTKCLRPGEEMIAFIEAIDESDFFGIAGVPRGAGIVWIALTKSRFMEVFSANGEVSSTVWSDVASFDVKSGMFGARLTYANTTWPDSHTTYKVDKKFAKAAQAIWSGPKSQLSSERTTAHLAMYPRLNQDFWFCDSCGQPCGSPSYSEAPYGECRGCLRTISGGKD